MKFIPASEGRCFTPAGHDKTVTSRLIYKNAVDIHVTTFPAGAGMAEEVHADFTHLFFVPVSYTHLTLPTKLEV